MKLKSNMALLLVVSVSAALFFVSAILSVNVTYGRYNTQFTNDIGFTAEPSPDVYVIQLNDEGSRVEFSPNWTVVGGEKCLSFVISNTDCFAESVTERDMTVRIRVFIPEQSEESEDSSNAEISEISDAVTEVDVSDEGVSDIFDTSDAASESAVTNENSETLDPTVSDISLNVSEVSEVSTAVSVNPGNLVFTIKIGSRTETFNSQVDYLSSQTPMYMESENGVSGWVYSFYKVIEFDNGNTLQNEVSYTLDGGNIADLPITITVQNLDLDTSDIVIYVDRVK